VRVLLDAGEPVRAAARSRSAVVSAFGDAVEAVALDFTDPGTWAAAYTGVREMFLLRPPHLSRPKTQAIVVPAGGGATAFVDAHDVAAVAAAALLDPAAHRDQAWTPTGPQALTYAEVAAALSRVLGRPITYTRPGVLTYARHAKTVLDLPVGMVLVTTAIYTAARLGQAGGLSNDVITVLGRPPISFDEFAHRERSSWTAS